MSAPSLIMYSLALSLSLSLSLCPPTSHPSSIRPPIAHPPSHHPPTHPEGAIAKSRRTKAGAAFKVCRGEPPDRSSLRFAGDMADIPADLKNTLLGKRDDADLGELSSSAAGTAAPSHAEEDERWGSWPPKGSQIKTLGRTRGNVS